VRAFVPAPLPPANPPLDLSGDLQEALEPALLALGRLAHFDNLCQYGILQDVPATMNISLPEALRDFVEDAVDAGGYSSVSEYMRELVRQAKQERELEERLIAALGSKDLGPLGPEFFDDLTSKARKAARRRK